MEGVIMNENEERDHLQNLAVEADAHQRRAQDIQNQMQTLQMLEVEMEKTEEALKNLKEGKNALFNLGSGMFISGEMKDTNKILVNVGSNILIEMNVDNALRFTTERKKEVSEAKEELIKGMQAISVRLNEIDTEARAIIKKVKGLESAGGA
jgi:prefoldin alpha subunit